MKCADCGNNDPRCSNERRFCRVCYNERKRHGSCQHYYQPGWTDAEDNIPGVDYDEPCWVYLLITDYGDYVGHTNDLDQREDDHLIGKVASTRGGRPYLFWDSGRPKRDRDAAANYEAMLKRWQTEDVGSFDDETGRDNPVPFRCPRCRG